MYQSEGNHSQALGYFAQSIEISRTIHNQSLESDGHRNRGAELLALRQPSEAVKEFDLSYKLGETTGEKVNMSIALYDLALAQMQLGHGADAIGSLERAGEMQASIKDRRDLADTRTRLADFELRLGDAGQALRIAQEAANLAASVDRPDALWQAKLVSGKALERLSRRDDAAAQLDGAIETIESLHLHVVGPPTAISTYFADKLEPYRERMALAVSAGKAPQALAFAERSRARGLAEILGNARPDIGKSLTSNERNQKKALENQLASLNILAERSAEKSSPSEIAALRSRLDKKRHELESFETALYTTHPELAEQRSGSGVITAEEMQKLTQRTGAIIVDYVVTPRITYVFVVRPSEKIQVYRIHITATNLAQSTKEFRRQLMSADLAFAQKSQELFHLLLGPIAPVLVRHPALIILPDGPLWDVAFQALQPKPGHYLIEDAPISYSPSLSVLNDMLNKVKSPDVASPDLLALGDPATASAERLPEAARQVHELAKLYGEDRSRIATGASATEEMFKVEAGRFGVVHVASHAVLDDSSPMYSRVLLAAEAGHEDGMLEAREVMDLNLRAEMVVLSACETARGEAPAGEGITGLLWAMFVAGSPTTVASLWRVESASTSELMVEFHRQWLQNRRSHVPLAKASAMRTAALKLIASPRYAHPFYWAGFIVAGSPI